MLWITSHKLRHRLCRFVCRRITNYELGINNEELIVNVEICYFMIVNSFCFEPLRD